MWDNVEELKPEIEYSIVYGEVNFSKKSLQVLCDMGKFKHTNYIRLDEYYYAVLNEESQEWEVHDLYQEALDKISYEKEHAYRILKHVELGSIILYDQITLEELDDFFEDMHCKTTRYKDLIESPDCNYTFFNMCDLKWRYKPRKKREEEERKKREYEKLAAVPPKTQYISPKKK